MVKIDKKQIALRFILSLVVAWIIITILTLPAPIPFQTFSAPDEVAEHLLKTNNSSASLEKFSDRVMFRKEHTISSAYLAKEVGLEKNQVCLSIEEGLTGFEVENNSLITFSKDSEARVAFAGICAQKEIFVSKDLIGTGTEILSSRGFDFVDSGCASVCPDNQKCCVLFLYKPD